VKKHYSPQINNSFDSWFISAYLVLFIKKKNIVHTNMKILLVTLQKFRNPYYFICYRLSCSAKNALDRGAHNVTLNQVSENYDSDVLFRPTSLKCNY